MTPTSRIGVDLVVDGETIPNVPFIVVQANGGQWLVEEIGLSIITGGRPGRP
jgi:hypothetical protein